MGWAVELTDESGRAVAPAVVGGDAVIETAQGEAGSSSPLQFIDPYGDTYWNTLQARAFLDEWRRLYELAASPGETRFVAEVEQLIRRCADGTHLYVKFIGD